MFSLFQVKNPPPTAAHGRQWPLTVGAWSWEPKAVEEALSHLLDAEVWTIPQVGSKGEPRDWWAINWHLPFGVHSFSMLLIFFLDDPFSLDIKWTRNNFFGCEYFVWMRTTPQDKGRWHCNGVYDVPVNEVLPKGHQDNFYFSFFFFWENPQEQASF